HPTIRDTLFNQSKKSLVIDLAKEVRDVGLKDEPALTRVGLSPTGPIQLAGRNMACIVLKARRAASRQTAR
ncbi:MAG: hypothetical protein WA614_13910, partial [Acidimicrobiales bacterium]